MLEAHALHLLAYAGVHLCKGRHARPLEVPGSDSGQENEGQSDLPWLH